MVKKYSLRDLFREFMAGYWPERIFEMHGSPERLPPVFSTSELRSVEELLAKYRGRVNFSRGSQSPNALTARLSAIELFRMGLTLYLPEVANVLPAARTFLAEFEQMLGVPANCARLGAFVSPPGEGAPCHYDAEDVFSVQLVGTKTFELAPMSQIKNPVGKQYSPGRKPYAELMPQACENGFPHYDNATFQTIKMHPGSVLYMPRGTWHRTTAHENSLAISVIINPPALLDVVLDQLHKILLQSAEWRNPVFAASRGEVAKTLSSLPTAVSLLSDELLQQYVAPVNEQIKSINATSRFIRRPDARLVAKQSDTSTMIIENKNSEGVWVNVAELRFNQPMLALAKWVETQSGSFGVAECQYANKGVSLDQVTGLLQLFVEAKLLDLLLYPEFRL